MRSRSFQTVTLGLFALAAVTGCEPTVQSTPPPACPQTTATPPTAAPTTAEKPVTPNKRPKLVVAIALDQFRADYLHRFDPYFGENGFKRLQKEGAVMTGHYGHYATYTGPGHALLLSGSYPYVNGISTNKFYNPLSSRSEAMVFDGQSTVLGLKQTEPDMDVSPRNFYGSTVGDELIMAQGQKSKTIALATKGRGAILMGGRLAKTYWMNDDTGDMTTSTYYAPSVPAWVETWNKKKLADSYFGKMWDRALPVSAYAGAAADDTASEAGWKGLGKTFPHKVDGKLKAPGPDYYEALCETPFANDWELDFAKTAVEAEQLGQRGVTDLLAISISATDLGGHDFGPMSHEVQDIVVRTDKQIGDFLDWLYGKLGKEEVLVVLSADHGGVPMPEQLATMGFSAARIKKKAIGEAVEKALKDKFGGEKWVVALEDPHIFLDRKKIEEKKLKPEEVEKAAGEAVAKIEGFGGYFTRSQLLDGRVPDSELGRSILRTYFVPRGGDVVMWTLPFYFWGKYAEKDAGTTHGTFYRYDTDVPLIFVGAGVKPGNYGVREMVDLAPTLSSLLGISRPAGAEGQIIPLAKSGN
ncbi:MAG: alkaline phosphatase family protein [Polyangiaceae bacterium]|nr:alkaline phosphatase family protein [Polyangiaceae bacterium]